MEGDPRKAPLWSPSPARIEHAHVTGFMRWAAEREGRAFDSYEELRGWSVDELEQFWAGIWDFCGVTASAPYERVLASEQMPGAQWFPGTRLNYAENLLGAVSEPDEPAVLHLSELRELDSLTRGELAARVASVAGGLRELGVARGDRVVAYMPNIAETLIAFLATASIGAIWSSAAPELGARSVIDRFAQIEPKVLFAVDGYRYGGRDYDRMEVLRELLAGMPSVEHVVVLDTSTPSRASRISMHPASRCAGSSSSASATARGRTSSRCPSITPSGSSTPPARRGCRRRSCTATAGSWSSSSRRTTCTSTCTAAIGCSGTRRPRG